MLRAFKFPVHFLIFMVRKFFQPLLPFTDMVSHGVELGAAGQPAVQRFLEGRAFAARRLELADLFVNGLDVLFQLGPFLRAVSGELGYIGQGLHMLHGVLAAFIDIPGSDRHGNPFDLLLRFFDIQADAVLDFMRRLFRFLQAGEFIFIVGHAGNAAVEILLLVEQGIDGFLALRRSDQEVTHMLGHFTAGQAHADAAFDAEEMAAHGFIGQDFEPLQVFQAHGKNRIIRLTVQAVPPQIRWLFLYFFLAV